MLEKEYNVIASLSINLNAINVQHVTLKA